MTDLAYDQNPMTTADRCYGRSPSAWIRSFDCSEMRVLIVCRGPIRKEAIDVFTQMGMKHIGVLLSEKDSIVYTHALAPELRQVHPRNVHRVPDYTGATSEERSQRIEQITQIAHQFGYDHVFAGYGFMAEDEDFVAAIEGAGLHFIGPCSNTVRAAGHKDTAKRTALSVGVSVTPGVDDLTTRTLLGKHGNADALRTLAVDRGLDLPDTAFEGDLSGVADRVLAASFEAGIDLSTIDELGAQAAHEVGKMLTENPGSRVRLKAIGGGGGKGQRIIGRVGSDDPATYAKEAPGKLLEILGEIKATAPGDNKNVLIELNIERTRHHEIQLVGNGTWCVSLGGRDCSLQQHEQKLLEISITSDALRAELEHTTGPSADALQQDLTTLERMEAEAERFGAACGLDSASTFECIVDGSRHYFMEVNTRIQVEHRVSELCYALRFTNPDDDSESFDVTALVEAMALLACHKERLPRPTRVPREMAAIEARLNATNASLSPHAGGMIQSWSAPLETEIRDDQGICIPNPDTGLFVPYRLAGAYDSNIALLVTHGQSRHDSFVGLLEIIRRARIRGRDLQTNLAFHYGLVSWLLANDVYAKPTTRFVSAYLAQVGLLKQEADRIDIWYGLKEVFAHHQRLIADTCSSDDQAAVLRASAACLNGKQTLVMRPMQRMLAEPHVLSAWLSAHRDDFGFDGDRVVWKINPVTAFSRLYDHLNMHYLPEEPAAYVIWDGDRDLLDRATRFYDEAARRLGTEDWPELDAALGESEPRDGFDPELWHAMRDSHRGFQVGLECLDILPLIGHRTGFWDLALREDRTVDIPARLADPDLQAAMKRVLAPPPATRADAIVAVSGGMYYAQEAPGLPPLVEQGDHFEAGQPLYVIEIMKMFNKINAPFAGTIDEVLMTGADGSIVSKGQPLFKVTPDEPLVEEDAAERAKRLHSHTESYLAALL